MSKTFILLSALWFFWELKYVLFWLYLWQLKEYHIGRFIDHFRTDKGKKLIFGGELILKFILFIFLILSQGSFSLIFYAILIVYFFEFLVFIRGLVRSSIKGPKRTLKTLFLTVISFALVFVFLYIVSETSRFFQYFTLLGFDILTPVIISIIVLLFQPFFVLLRGRTLIKAKHKMETIKSTGNLKVIAITGSYGKTSTKEFLATILSKKFKVLNTKEHQNSEIGIAKCILEDLKPEHQIFIAEVGAYNKGKVKEVCSVIKPAIGVVTGVNEQHLALFGSIDNLLLAEGGGELAEALLSNGTLIVNGDNKYCLDLYKKFHGNKKIYSLNNKEIDSDIWSDHVTVHRDNISFIAVDKFGNLAHFGANVLGKQNVQNLLGAILVARELGMTFEKISEACNGISERVSERVSGMVLRGGRHGINIIDSSYSANPDGVLADLDYLSIFPTKKVIVMPCLIELGDKSASIHEKLGKKIGKVCNLAVITSKDKFREIERGFSETKKDGARCILCDKPKDIYNIITLSCKSGDAVLLEGRVPIGLVKLLEQ